MSSNSYNFTLAEAIFESLAMLSNVQDRNRFDTTIQQQHATMVPSLMSATASPTISELRPFLSRKRPLSDRERLFVMVKILLKFIELSGDDDEQERLGRRVKAVIRECTRRNRMGDSNFTPLRDAVERQIRRAVGDAYWTRTGLYLDRYCERRGLSPSYTHLTSV